MGHKYAGLHAVARRPAAQDMQLNRHRLLVVTNDDVVELAKKGPSLEVFHLVYDPVDLREPQVTLAILAILELPYPNIQELGLSFDCTVPINCPMTFRATPRS